jgi:surface antigen
MNIEEVRALGQDLQTRAATIDELMGTVERVVVSANWVGPDARRFKDQWWPEHRARLQKVSQDLRGFGQSALNNASEQEQASGGGAGEARVGVVPGFRDGGGLGRTPGESVPEDGGGTISVPGGGNIRGRFVDFWEVEGNNPGYDRNNFANTSSGNCTSYAAWRLNDLAQENGLEWSMSNNHIGEHDGLRLSHAAYWDDRARELGIPVNDTPSPGAIAQWNEPYADGYGHVAVVRSFDAETGAITIEESAWSGAAFGVKTLKPGDAGYPDNFIHMLPGS